MQNYLVTFHQTLDFKKVLNNFTRIPPTRLLRIRMGTKVMQIRPLLCCHQMGPSIYIKPYLKRQQCMNNEYIFQSKLTKKWRKNHRSLTQLRIKQIATALPILNNLELYLKEKAIPLWATKAKDWSKSTSCNIVCNIKKNSSTNLTKKRVKNTHSEPRLWEP